MTQSFAGNINGVYEINNLVKERKAKEKMDEFGERRHGDGWSKGERQVDQVLSRKLSHCGDPE